MINPCLLGLSLLPRLRPLLSFLLLLHLLILLLLLCFGIGFLNSLLFLLPLLHLLYLRLHLHLPRLLLRLVSYISCWKFFVLYHILFLQLFLIIPPLIIFCSTSLSYSPASTASSYSSIPHEYSSLVIFCSTSLWDMLDDECVLVVFKLVVENVAPGSG